MTSRGNILQAKVQLWEDYDAQHLPEGLNIRYMVAILIYDIFFYAVDLCALGCVRKPFLSAKETLLLGVFFFLFPFLTDVNESRLHLLDACSILRMNSRAMTKWLNAFTIHKPVILNQFVFSFLFPTWWFALDTYLLQLQHGCLH